MAVQKLVVLTIVNVKSRISIAIHVATKVAKLVSTMNKGGITLRAGETFFALNPVIFKVGS